MKLIELKHDAEMFRRAKFNAMWGRDFILCEHPIIDVDSIEWIAPSPDWGMLDKEKPMPEMITITTRGGNKIYFFGYMYQLFQQLDKAPALFERP